MLPHWVTSWAFVIKNAICMIWKNHGKFQKKQQYQPTDIWKLSIFELQFVWTPTYKGMQIQGWMCASTHFLLDWLAEIYDELILRSNQYFFAFLIWWVIDMVLCILSTDLRCFWSKFCGSCLANMSATWSYVLIVWSFISPFPMHCLKWWYA